MQWPNGKSVLEILRSYLTPGHTECGGLSGFFEVPACNKPSALDGLQFSSFEVSLFFGNIVSTLATLMVTPCQQREKCTRHDPIAICIFTDYVSIQIPNCFFRTGEMFKREKKTSPLPNQKRKWIDTRLTNSAYAFFKCPPELVTCNRRQRRSTSKSRQLCQTIVAPPWAIHRNKLCSSYSHLGYFYSGRIGPLYDIGNTCPNFGCANGNISSIQSIKHFRIAHSSGWLYLIAPWPWLHSQPLDWFFGWHAKGKSTSCQSQKLDGLFFQLVGCTLKAVQSIVASNVRCLTNLFNLLHASSLLSSFFPYDFCCLFHLFLAMLCVSYRLLFAKGWRFGAKNSWVGVSLQKGSISKNTENGCIKSEIVSCFSSLFRPTAKLPGLGECGHCASK